MPVKKLIERIEVGAGGAASITFSAIPQTYTHLVLVVSARMSTAPGGFGYQLRIYPNGSSANMTRRRLYGSGSGVGSESGTTTDVTLPTGANTANTFSNASIYFPNYASSNFKSISVDSVDENNGTTAYQWIDAGLWSVTSAISSITLTPQTSTLAQYSSASLYGITRGSDGTTTVS